MKRKGFALMELVVALSVLSCIVSISALSYGFIKNIEDEEKAAMCIRNLDDTITSARLYCMKNNTKGSVFCYKETGEYSFYTNTDNYSKPVRIEKLEKNMHFNCSTGVTGWELRISNLGIPEPCTISIIDDNKKIYNITIGVGNSNEKVYC